MEVSGLLDAAALGVIEGLTEFLPVSSTGHILLAEHFLGFESRSAVFEIVIQLGAILAVVALYFRRLARVALDFPTKTEARYFVFTVLAAFMPVVVLGALLHGFIKEVLFASPGLIAGMLIAGGVVMLLVERLPKREIITDPERLPLRTAVGIGLFQCISMIPGVSRSGATIIGGMLLGVSRKAAAEFSFFLSIPTMVGASTFDLYKNHAALDSHDLTLILVGFGTAFLSALVVVQGFIGFISRHGLTPFAWYRIALGTVMLVALALGW
ncbi:MAG: undecaprenyl-diphosphate phosphatase [Alphaproteobacteria bacterium]